MTFGDTLRSIDIFGQEPSVLTFGDPDNPKTRQMWKTPCGGVFTVGFVTLVILYIAYGFIAIDSGIRDIIEDIVIGIDEDSMGSVSLEEMKVMPVIHFSVERPHIYIDTTTKAFEKSIFVALASITNKDGVKKAEY